MIVFAALPARRLHDLLHEAAMPAGAEAGVADDARLIIARSGEAGGAAGGAMVSAALSLRDRGAGIFRQQGAQGTRRLVAFHGLAAAPGWTVFVGEPAEALEWAWRMPLLLFVLGGLAALLVGGGLALSVARRLLLPLESLASQARLIVASAGALASAAGRLPPSPIAELETLRQGFAAAEATLRRRAEAEQRVAAELAGKAHELRAIFDASPIGLARSNIDGRISEANAAILRMLGIDARAIATGDVRWTDLTAPESQGVTEAAIARALAAPDGFSGLYGKTFLRPDGGRVHTLSSFVLLDRRSGDVANFVLDITEVEQTEARLQDLLDTVDMGAFMTRTIDGTIRYWSAGCERLYGWTAQEAIGRTSHDLLRTEWPLALDALNATLLKDGAWSGDLHQRTKDGRAVIVGALKRLRRNAGGEPVILELLTDVTAHRRAEAALRASEARWRTLAESFPGFVVETDAAGRNTYVNSRVQEFTGLPAEALLGDGWQAIVHPDDAPRTLSRWRHAVESGTGYEVEYRFRGADGHYAWYLARGLPQRDAAGAILRWWIACIDISEIVAAREAATRNAAELERLVQVRSRELEAAQERLAQAAKLEALGRLAGGVAHDFNNVLQAVQGGVALALGRLATHPDRVPGYLNIASEAAGRGIAVTSRLLAFARRGELSAEPVDPAAVLRGLQEMLQHTLGPSVQVTLDIAPDLPAVLADKAQLETVLINLANNARDAMPGAVGALCLAAAAEDAATGETATGETATGEAGDGGEATSGDAAAGGGRASFVRFSIIDDGAGMSAEVLARVSEPFFTTKPRGAGTGLGLAMARGFAEQSGGSLSIRSAPGRGTTVSLRLPVARLPPAFPPGGGVDDPPQAVRAMLVVDDERMVRLVVASMLVDQGHHVQEAGDARAALALLDSGAEVDVLVTDLAMPGEMDGLGLIEEVRRRRCGLPALLLTGHSGDADPAALAAAGRSGPFMMLRKPVTAAVLRERIGRLLSARGGIPLQEAAPVPPAGGSSPPG